LEGAIKLLVARGLPMIASDNKHGTGRFSDDRFGDGANHGAENIFHHARPAPADYDHAGVDLVRVVDDHLTRVTVPQIVLDFDTGTLCTAKQLRKSVGGERCDCFAQFVVGLTVVKQSFFDCDS
jgi:hypothetical protein